MKAKQKYSSLVKNQYPEIFGYGHPWDIPGNEMCGLKNPINKGKKKEEIPDFVIPFMSTVDGDGDTRYAPVTKKLVNKIKEMESKEEEISDGLSRCIIPSERKGLVRCMKDCKHCPYKKNPDDPDEPYHRTGGTISIDYLFENYELEFEDESQQRFFKELNEEMILKKVRELVQEREELDRQIFELITLSDSEIARRLNVPRTTVRDHRKRMSEDLMKYFEIN